MFKTQKVVEKIWEERGVTLLEMLFAIAITSIVGVGILQIFRTDSYLYSGERASTFTISNSRNVMDEITREIRMAGYNPNEIAGGVFWIKQCNSAIGSAFTTNAITGNTTFCFTMDYNSDGTLAKDGSEMVAFNWAGPPVNTLEVGVIDPSTGLINSWQDKFTNVINFSVDYSYSGGALGSAVGLPGSLACTDLATNCAYNQIAGILLNITVRSEKPHELTKQYINETLQTTIMLRNKYF
jgi:prepilin-type N-terminal cleavage/methylation domain-containing protein